MRPTLFYCRILRALRDFVVRFLFVSRLVACFGIAIVLAGAGPAGAHERSVSYSGWRLRGTEAEVAVRLAEIEVSRFPWWATAGGDRDRILGEYLVSSLRLYAGDILCEVGDGPRRLRAAPGRIVYEWRLACPAAGPFRIVSDLFRDVAPSHLHFARVQTADGLPRERVLADADRMWILVDESPHGGRETHGTTLGGYVWLGIEHILSGYDHLAFLLALLLIEMSLGEVARIVTGFTVGHSLTLGLAVMGFVRPQATAIEALIGLSIALVAAENAWILGGRRGFFPWALALGLAALAAAAAAGYGNVSALTLAGLALFTFCYLNLLLRARRATRVRWCVAFLFGLVHGFGFAGILAEASLPPERLVQGLFGFNAGVEIGQLAAVLVAWPLLRLAMQPGREPVRNAVVHFGSAATCALGVFWFVSRAYG